MSNTDNIKFPLILTAINDRPIVKLGKDGSMALVATLPKGETVLVESMTTHKMDVNGTIEEVPVPVIQGTTNAEIFCVPILTDGTDEQELVEADPNVPDLGYKPCEPKMAGTITVPEAKQRWIPYKFSDVKQTLKKGTKVFVEGTAGNYAYIRINTNNDISEKMLHGYVLKSDMKMRPIPTIVTEEENPEKEQPKTVKEKVEEKVAAAVNTVKEKLAPKEEAPVPVKEKDTATDYENNVVVVIYGDTEHKKEKIERYLAQDANWLLARCKIAAGFDDKDAFLKLVSRFEYMLHINPSELPVDYHSNLYLEVPEENLIDVKKRILSRGFKVIIL